MESKAGWTGLSQGLQAWGFLSVAACVGTGQAQVWAKLDISQLRRQNLILPPKGRGTGAYTVWEGNGRDSPWAMSFCSCWRKKDGGLVGLILGETGPPGSGIGDRTMVALPDFP